MGCSSMKTDLRQIKAISVDDGNIKTLEEEKTKNKNLFDFFNEKEITFIKKEKDKFDKWIKEGDKTELTMELAYHKFVINMIEKEKTFKHLIVLYIPTNFNKFQSNNYIYNFNHNKTIFQFKENYTHVENNPKIKKSISFGKDKTNPCIKTDKDFIITQKDLEKNLILLEYSYNIDYEPNYGFHSFKFIEEDYDYTEKSMSLIYDDNFKVQYKDKNYEELSKTKLFSFCMDSDKSKITLKDKRITLNIMNELSEELISVFSDAEIQQINNGISELKYKK